MRKGVILLIGVFFAISAAGVAFAQEKATSEKPLQPAQAKISKSEDAKKNALPKTSEYRMGGIISNIDPMGKKITLKQSKVKKERVVTLKMNKALAKEMSGLKNGDAVNVWVHGNYVQSLRKVE